MPTTPEERLKEKLGGVFQPIDMFATPESMKALQHYVASISDDGERGIATVVMCMTWNLACAYVAERTQ